MKTTKRFLALLLAACMLLCCVPLAFAADPVFTDVASAAAYLRENLVGRKSDVTFVYRAPKSAVGELNNANLSAYFSTQWNAIEDAALAHTGKSNEGDYLERHLGPHGYHCGISYSSQESYINYSVTATAEYYTTAAQEAQVKTAVSNALSGLKLSGKSDYAKVRAINDYICDHVTYDYTNLNNNAYKLKYSAYAALINGTSVCQGYASLFYRMALEAGLDCRVITGDADNGESIGGHAWNIVKVDGKYYNIDVTWNDGTVSDDYFLKGTKNWGDHYPDAEPLNQYTVSAADYDPSAPHTHTDANKDGKCDSCGFVIVAAPAVPQNVSAKATAEKQITVSWSAVSGATQYNIYRYNGAKKDYVYKGTTMATAARPTQYADGGLTAGTTYYYKVVAVKKTSDYTLVSAKSAAASAMAQGAPAVPQNVTAKAGGDKKITVSWNRVAGATQYNIYRYNGAKQEYIYKGTTMATAAKPTQYTDTGLSLGTSYYYKVVAVVKGDGLTLVSAKSAAASAKALGTPGVPQNVNAVSAAAKTVTVSWSRVTGATQYNVYRYNGTKKAYVYVGTTFATAEKPTQYVAAGLNTGTTYYFKVLAAVKGDGLTFVGAQSPAVSAKVR